MIGTLAVLMLVLIVGLISYLAVGAYVGDKLVGKFYDNVEDRSLLDVRTLVVIAITLVWPLALLIYPAVRLVVRETTKSYRIKDQDADV